MQNHGWTHANDIDPIPGMAAAGASEYGFGYELKRELIEPADFSNQDTGSGTVTFDSSYYRGFHATLANANSERAYFGLRLGPKGAMYHLQFIAQRGPDCGKFRFEWAQIPDTDHDGDFYPNSLSIGTSLFRDGLIYSPEDSDAILNWVVFGTGDEQDLYNATVVANGVGNTSPGSAYQQFRIMGDPGDVLSADVSSGSTTTYGSDGGPGIYLLKVVCTGKNASSSGFNIRLSSLVISREFSDNFSV